MDASVGSGGAFGTGGRGDASVATGGVPTVDASVLDAATSGEFLALTYNVAGLPEALTGSPNPLTRMPLISPLLNDYDLVLVQEDWLTPDPNPLAPTRVYHELLDDSVTHPYRSIPMPVPLDSDPTRTTALVSDGLNEFSRIFFNPARVEHVRWTECFGDAQTGAGDCLATKGFTLTVHSLARGITVDVYNLHGEAGRTTEDLRLMQQDFETELSAYVNAHSAGHAIILGGDTNLHTDRTPDGPIWQAFKVATGLVDVCDTIACGADADQIDKFAYRSSKELSDRAIEPRFRQELQVHILGRKPQRSRSVDGEVSLVAPRLSPRTRFPEARAHASRVAGADILIAYATRTIPRAGSWATIAARMDMSSARGLDGFVMSLVPRGNETQGQRGGEGVSEPACGAADGAATDAEDTGFSARKTTPSGSSASSNKASCLLESTLFGAAVETPIFTLPSFVFDCRTVVSTTSPASSAGIGRTSSNGGPVDESAGPTSNALPTRAGSPFDGCTLLGAK